MYTNSNINNAITKTTSNIAINFKHIPDWLGLVQSDYRRSVFENDKRYYEYSNEGITGCSCSAQGLMNGEVDYYRDLISSLMGLKLNQIKVNECLIPPVEKTNIAVWDKLTSDMDGLVNTFKPLLDLAYVCREKGLHQGTYNINNTVIDSDDYTELYDLYYDIILINNNSSKDEDEANGCILRYLSRLMADSETLWFRLDNDYYDEDDDEYYDGDPDEDDEY